METDFEPFPAADDVEGLIWAALDGCISEADFRRLDELLCTDDDARRLYVQCVQLHVDLLDWYRSKRGCPSGASSAPIGLPIDMPLPGWDVPLVDPAW